MKQNSLFVSSSNINTNAIKNVDLSDTFAHLLPQKYPLHSQELTHHQVYFGVILT